MVQPWYQVAANKLATSQSQNQVNRSQLIGPHTFIGLSHDGVAKANSPNLEGELGGDYIGSPYQTCCQISEVAKLTGISEKRVEELVRTSRVYFQIKSVED